MSVREPAADWDGMLRMEDIRRRGIVDDDSFPKVSTDLGEILLTSQSKP